MGTHNGMYGFIEVIFTEMMLPYINGLSNLKYKTSEIKKYILKFGKKIDINF